MDRDYRIVAKRQGALIDPTKSGLPDFPIEIARLRSIWFCIAVVLVCMTGYGWSLHFQVVSIEQDLSTIS